MTTEVEVEKLLRSAGRRPPPPPQVTAAVYESAHRVWQQQVRMRRNARRVYAAAAAVALAIIGLWNIEMHASQARLVAVSDGGAITIQKSLWRALTATPRGQIYEGDMLKTGSVGASVRRVDGTEFRMARNSTVSFSSADTVQLRNGRLFIDTHPESGAKSLRILTEFGAVEHLGTRFQVANDHAQMWVAVRAGQVTLRALDQAARNLTRGKAAQLDGKGRWRLWDLDTLDATWDWADQLSQPLEIEGRSLHNVLSHIAQVAGIELSYSNADAESDARALILHGAPLDLPPRDAFVAVLATSSLSGTLGDGRFFVTARN
jgi:ferric-dicitrate binding protein FerR (iron transport regulator)